MADFRPGRDVLFVDIDGTLTDWTAPPPREGEGALCGSSLMWLMWEMAVEQGADPAEAEAVIRRIFTTMRWWHYTDFLRALNLDPAAFWAFAHRRESEYIGPVEAGLPVRFRDIQRAGFHMIVTSNNPSSGILHKLRIAGLGQIWGSPFFLQYLSPPDLHCMKCEGEFWHRALAHTGLPPDRAIVIGDLWRDDVEAPREAGIRRSILLDRTLETATVKRDGVWLARDWRRIVALLLGTSTAAEANAAKCPGVAAAAESGPVG